MKGSGTQPERGICCPLTPHKREPSPQKLLQASGASGSTSPLSRLKFKMLCVLPAKLQHTRLECETQTGVPAAPWTSHEALGKPQCLPVFSPANGHHDPALPVGRLNSAGHST